MNEGIQKLHISPGIAGRHSARRGFDFPLHEHTEWEFVFYTRGRVSIHQGDEVFEAAAGDLVLTPPGTPHSEHAITDYANIFMQVFAPAEMPWSTVVPDDRSGALGRVMEQILIEDLAELKMRGLLMEQLELLLNRFMLRNNETSSRWRLVVEAERRLRDRFAEPFSLAELARDLDVSPSYLRAAFLDVRGRSARDYFGEVRLQRVLAYLRTSTLTLEHIASLTGFSSASHLSRVVRAETGSTPGRLRRSVEASAHSSSRRSTSVDE